MSEKKNSTKILMLCAMAVCLNVAIGSIFTSLHIPLFYLDAIGTIFIAFHFDMKYGILTGLCTNLLLAVLFGPLAIPFSLVSMTVAVVANLCARTGMTYKKTIISGILIALTGALVSAPIRLALYGGFEGLSRTVSDMLIISLKVSGAKMITAAYWGAFIDNLADKIVTCLLVHWLSQLKQLKPVMAKLKKNDPSIDMMQQR